MGKQILFVDDEKSILKALERLFFDTDYEIFTADSGEEGLRILAANPIDVVVSDMRMPEMDGHQFLTKVKTLYPGTTRLILSGYAEEKEIFRSLINGSSNLYLFKPWDGDDLKKKLAQIFDSRQIFCNRALLDLANGLDNLSLITGIYNLVSKLIDQEAEITAIAKVIETDPSVTAAVLRIVNSAFYNIKTGSVSQAITFLGLPILKSIVLSCSLFKFAVIKVPPFSIALLTRHASTTNLFMAQIYSTFLKKHVPDTLATAGLLHNMGLLLNLHYFPEQYNKIIHECTANPGKQLPELEREYIGVSHSELGGYLLNWWSIPYPIVECALFHHDPQHKAIIDTEAVAAIHIANYYAWKALSPQVARSLDLETLSRLDITQQDCDQLLRV